MRNLHKTYYKDYFREVDFGASTVDNEANRQAIARVNSTITGKGLLSVIPRCEACTHYFDLTVIYPGLATGTGITHEAGIQGEFKLGLHFDYTYGMPVIYGSSVKGVLRSYFRDEYQKPDVLAVEADIFDGERNGKPKPIYDRDIFFDAVVIEPFYENEEDEHGKLLAGDAITPHKDPLKNPVPISFLKVTPGCQVEFRFRLVDSIITAEEKKKIFKRIIRKYGLGAKTNVGYGQFEEFA